MWLLVVYDVGFILFFHMASLAPLMQTCVPFLSPSKTEIIANDVWEFNHG